VSSPYRFSNPWTAALSTFPNLGTSAMDSCNQVSFVSGLPTAGLGIPHSGRRSAVHQNPLHYTRPPSPPKGGCNRAKGIVQTACQRIHGRGFKIFFTYRSSFSTLAFTNPFYARVVSIPPSPPEGGCSYAARAVAAAFIPAGLLRLLRNRPRPLGIGLRSGTGFVTSEAR